MLSITPSLNLRYELIFFTLTNPLKLYTFVMKLTKAKEGLELTQYSLL